MPAATRLIFAFLAASLALALPTVQGPERAVADEGELALPKPGYAKALHDFKEIEHENEELDIQLRVLPDLYRYDMAVGIEALQKTGAKGDKLRDKLEDLHKQHKKKKDRIGVIFTIRNFSSSRHLFLQAPLDKHVDVKEKSGKVKSIRDAEPDPKFARWTVFAGAGQKKCKLCYFDELTFMVEIQVKDKTEPLTVQFEKLLRYQETEKRSPYAKGGINKDSRQVTVGSFENLQFPTIEKTLYPGTWELPEEPAEFAKILSSLN